MRKHMAEKRRLSSIFCKWCVSKGVKHTQECPSKKEGFDESTPPLTDEERNTIIKQKNEARNKGKNITTQHTTAEGELHGDVSKV
jgi:hypothetical protein